MNILHISRTMGQGGAEKIIYQLCRDNKSQKQFVISDGGEFVTKLNRIGIPHYTMPDIGSGNPFRLLICFFKILRVVKKEKIDLIHSHHRMAAFLAQLVSYLVPVKLVYTAHNVFQNKKKITRFSLTQTQIVAVGNGVRDNLVSFFGITPSKISVIYNAISTKVSENPNLSLNSAKKEGKYLIGTIGRISRQKGIDIFIRSVAQIKKRHPNILGVVVGSGEKLAEMKELSISLGIRSSIVFLGYQENVLDLINQLDIVVLASRWEGLPLTPIEVFSQGKTIVASNISGNNEIVKDEHNGLLFEKDSIFGLTNQLERVISNPHLVENLQRNAKSDFNKNYNYETFIQSYNSIYQK